MIWMTGNSWQMRKPLVLEKEKPKTKNWLGHVQRKEGTWRLNKGSPGPASVLGNGKAWELSPHGHHPVVTLPRSPPALGRKHPHHCRNSHQARFLSLESLCIWQTCWSGYGNQGCFPGKSNLSHKRQKDWVMKEFRRWTRTKPSDTTVSYRIFDTSLWKRDISIDVTAQGDKYMLLLVLWKYFWNNKDNLVSKDNNLFIYFPFPWPCRGFGT